MAIDFTKPATTDNYATGFVPNINNAINALGMWLDPSYAGTITSPPTGAKRYNAGRAQQWGGAAWADVSLQGIVFDGSNLTIGTGNIGLGPAPSWGATGFRSVQMLGGFFAGYDDASTNQQAEVSANAYQSALNTYNRYRAAGALAYRLINGTGHTWSYAASSTAGSAITWTEAMRIDTSGNLILGATSQTGIGSGSDKFSVSGAIGITTALNAAPGTNNFLEIYNRSTGGGIKFYVAAGGTLAATFSSTAHLGVGVTPTVRLHAKNTGDIFRVETSTARGSGAGYMSFADPTGRKAYFGYDGADDTFRLVNEMSSALVIGTNNAEALRLSTTGQVTMKGGSVGLAASANTAFSVYNGNASTWISVKDSGSRELLLGTEASIGVVGTFSSHDLDLRTANTLRMKITSTGTIQDAAGIELGYKGIPNASITSGTIPNSDRGKLIRASGSVTVATTTGVTVGDAFTIYNDTTGVISITQGASVTLRLGGTATTGTRTLASRGLCTVVYVGGSSEFVASGAGLT